MPTPLEPTRLQLELREETWVAPGLTALAWRTRSSPAPLPSITSVALTAECACPADCIRDHETD